MTKTIYLTFDGKVFRPEEPVELEPDTRVRAIIETAERVRGGRGAFLETARSLNLDGPPDWSSRLEEYQERRSDR
ncbi:MAG: hypothetical protein HY766_13625 [candidate division NC10 bacterium]|nr:hypothetical protein [candidate division NC10 bacterium]